MIAGLAYGAAARAHEPHRGVIAGHADGVAGRIADLPLTTQAPPERRAVPGRIVVKYRDAVDACAHCLLKRGTPFATVTGSGSLDRLNAALGVRAARGLFAHRHGMGSNAARAAFARRLDAARQRFPLRAMRAAAERPVPDLSAVYVLELAAGVDVEAAARDYAADPAVAWAVPDVEVDVGFTPNDPYLSTSGSWGQAHADLWGFDAVRARTAWDTATGQGTVIAVIDTGVDVAHPDLAANVWTNPGEIAGNGVDDDLNGFVDDSHGWDFVDDDPVPDDRHGHGTHVAGTAAAAGNNATGIAGMAFGARVMPVKGLADDGFGATSRLVSAILYAAENGADVINNSWGGFGPNDPIFEVIDVANALGVVVVSAAGNDGMMTGDHLWLPGGHPRGLTVGATTTSGDRASFSNYGFELSVLAPGVDVLSARSSREGFPGDLDVGSDYLRLSGTSMASPHVAGAAALVLSANPALTTSEVRWHVELGAEQPGAPGYEGERFNPSFGYGRLDAAAALGVPPVTTRLTPPGNREWHAFADAVRAVPGRSGDVLFTTLEPVPWTLTTPPWLVAMPASGTTGSPLDLALDTTGIAPGTYTGALALAAPAAIDGGGEFSTRLHVHADGRIGDLIPLGTNGLGGSIGFTPAGGGNGLSSVVAFQAFTGEGNLHYRMVDGAGTVSHAGAWTQQGYVTGLAVASDGHDFLVAWTNDFPDETEAVRFARLGADGTPLDAEPVEAYVRPERSCIWYDLAGAAFDGSVYWIALMESGCGGESNLQLIPVRRDGSAGKLVKLGGIGDTGYAPNFACRAGGCLFAWLDRTPIATEPGTGKYIRQARAIEATGGRLIGTAHQIIPDSGWISDLASDGSGFLVLSQQYDFCGPGDLCRARVLVSRVGADGQPQGAPIVVSNVPPAERLYPYPSGLTWTGDGWIASMGVLAVSDSPFFDGGYLFTARLDATGTPLSSEFVGDLVDETGRADESIVVAAATHTLVAWEDGRNDPLVSPAAYPHPMFTEHVARRIAPREPGPMYPDRQIGLIGAQSIDEGDTLRFRVTAPGLSPAAIFSAAGLPAGAVFDPASRIIQWRPAGNQAGTYGGIVLSATDGVASASETIAITVHDALASITGFVRLESGGGVGSVAVQVRGTADRQRTITTAADGTYRLEGGLKAGKAVKVKLARAMRRQYRARPSTVRVIATTGDIQMPDLVVTPR